MDRWKGEFGGHTVTFWAVVAGAILIRLHKRRPATILEGLVSIGIGIFCALVLTVPTIDSMGWTASEGMIAAVGAAWGFIGETVIGVALKAANIEVNLAELIRAWRGK